MDSGLRKSLAIALGLLGLMGAWIILTFQTDFEGAALGIFSIWFLLMGLWLSALVDAARVPAERWQGAGLDKTTWIVLLIAANFAGAIAYFGWIRKRLASGPGPGGA